MTRAALLHLLDSPAALPAAAVQDLEQLVQAFPYCQTAHLLLAKAAHDQGSMLAAQRLRRAATYATDRQLLRQLLERPATQPDVPITESPAGSDSATAVAPPTAERIVEERIEAIPVAAAEIGTPTGAGPLTPMEGVGGGTADLTGEAAGLGPHAVAAEATAAEIEAEIESISSVSAAKDEVGEVEAPEALPAQAAQKAGSQLEAEAHSAGMPADEVLQAPAIAAPEFLAGQVPASQEVAAAGQGPVGGESEPKEIGVAEVAVVADEAEAVPLPPIRPPAEAGTARFEFGLSSAALAAEFTSYQLPEPPADELVAPRPSPTLPGPAAFRGGADLAYALSGGSRLGYAMQSSRLVEAAAADTTTAADMPGCTLPAAGEFFPPDALLLEHLASQPPPAPPAPSSLDLIDSFLRRAPQRRRGIVTLLTVPEQADLSLRSTRAESDLASESLARILAGQGKTERAIAVYERLMVRQPEKSAYFAVQIDLLRQPPTPSS